VVGIDTDRANASGPLRSLLDKHEPGKPGNKEYWIGSDGRSLDRWSAAVHKFYGGWSSVAAYTASPLETGRWYHLVFSRGTDALKKIWIDAGSESHTAPSSGGFVDGTNPLRLGGTAGGDSYLDGRLAMVGFWKRELSAEERAFLYNGGNGRTYAELGAGLKDPALMAYWDLSEASGARADSHGTSHLSDSNGVSAAAGPGSRTTVKLYWGTSDGGTNAGAWQHEEDFGYRAIGPLAFTPTNLALSTTYYYRYMATNTSGAWWATNSEVFTTAATDPDIDRGGMPDAREALHGVSDPNVAGSARAGPPAAGIDTDGDGVLDIIEYLSGTDSNDAGSPVAEDREDLELRLGDPYHSNSERWSFVCLTATGQIILVSNPAPGDITVANITFVRGHSYDLALHWLSGMADHDYTATIGGFGERVDETRSPPWGGSKVYENTTQGYYIDDGSLLLGTNHSHTLFTPDITIDDAGDPRPIRLHFPDIVSLTLRNACGQAVLDTNDTDSAMGPSNTLFLCQGADSATLEIEIDWAPDALTNAPSPIYRWGIFPTNGTTVSTDWHPASGAYTSAVTTVTNAVWTMPSGVAVTDRVYVVRAWYDQDLQEDLDPGERHRELYATIMRIEDIAVARTYPAPRQNDPVLMSGDEFEASVTRQPASGGLRWSVAISNRTEAAPIRLASTDTSTNTIYRNMLMDMGAGGSIVLTVRDAATGCCLETRRIDVRCDCRGEACTAPEFETLNGSIDVRFGLGAAPGGGSAGSLYIRSETPDPALGSPSSLIPPRWQASLDGGSGADPVSRTWPELEMIASNGAPRQIRTAEVLADILLLSDSSYRIDFHSAASVGSKSNGLYTTTGPALVGYVVTNLADGLKISELRGGTTNVTQYSYASGGGTNTWTLSTGNGLRSESRGTHVDGAGNKSVTHQIANATGQVSYKAIETYEQFTWGSAIVEQVIDPDGAALTQTWSYYTNAVETGKYSRVKLRVEGDGGWRRYDYDAAGRTTVEVSPFGDSGTNAPVAEARAVYYDYTPRPGEPAGYALYRPRTVIETALGATNAITYHAFATNAAGGLVEIVERAASLAAGYNAAGNLRTTRTYYPAATNAPAAFRLQTVDHPDGRRDSYEYGYTNFLAATDERTVLTRGTTNAPAGIANRTTREVFTDDTLGRRLSAQTEVYTGSAYEAVDWTRWYRDELGRATNVAQANGTYTQTGWACCGKEYEVDASGIRTDYLYDDLKRVETAIKEASPNVTTYYTHDASGRQLSVQRFSGGLSLVSSNRYDLAGRLTNTVDEAGLVTVYTYASGGRIATVVAPGNATNITENYLDGRVKSVTGNAGVHQYYLYGSETNGTQWTQIFTGPDGTNSPDVG
jgi:hypothetical protein